MLLLLHHHFCFLSFVALCTSGRSLLTIVGAGMELKRTTSHSGRNIPFTNLSLIRVPTRTGDTYILTMPGTTQTLQSPIWSLNFIVLIAVTNWLVTFLNDGGLFSSVHKIANLFQVYVSDMVLLYTSVKDTGHGVHIISSKIDER